MKKKIFRSFLIYALQVLPMLALAKPLPPIYPKPPHSIEQTRLHSQVSTLLVEKFGFKASKHAGMFHWKGWVGTHPRFKPKSIIIAFDPRVTFGDVLSIQASSKLGVEILEDRSKPKPIFSETIDFSDVRSMGKLFESLEKQGIIESGNPNIATFKLVISNLTQWRKRIGNLLASNWYESTENVYDWTYRHDGALKNTKSYHVQFRLIDSFVTQSVLCELTLTTKPLVGKQKSQTVILNVSSESSFTVLKSLVVDFKKRDKGVALKSMKGLLAGTYYEEAVKSAKRKNTQRLLRVVHTVSANLPVPGESVFPEELDAHRRKSIANYMARLFEQKVTRHASIESALKEIRSTLEEIVRFQELDLEENKTLRTSLQRLLAETSKKSDLTGFRAGVEKIFLREVFRSVRRR